MTDRRRFVGALAAGLTVAARAANAQAKVPRVGILGNEDGTAWEGFRQGMRDLGYVDGRNVALVSRWSGGRPERHPALARELLAANVDVIVASSTQAIRAAKDATGTIPIVMAISAYPERIGLVESLARPGGNVTGLTNVAPELMGKRFQLLKQLAPAVARLAVIWNPASPVEQLALPNTQAAAAAASMELVLVEARTPEDLPASFAAITAGRADALHAYNNPVNARQRRPIAEFALKHRLPSSYEARDFVDAGGLFCYAPSAVDLCRRAATYVDRILKGSKPAEMPVEQPTKFELVFNQRTASAIGVALPPTLVQLADDVIR